MIKITQLFTGLINRKMLTAVTFAGGRLTQGVKRWF